MTGGDVAGVGVLDGPSRRWRRLAAASALVGTLLAAGLGAPARADEVQNAQARAAALRGELLALQQQADQAVEQYDLAEGELGQQTNAQIGLERALADARIAEVAARTQQGSRARALYQSGGMTGLYASVLNSADIGELLGRTDVVTRILSGDRDAASKAAAAASQVATRRSAASASSAAAQRKAAHVADLATLIQGLLGRQQALVATADAQVLVLVRAQEAAATAAAAAAFQSQLAAAQANPAPARGGAGSLSIGPAAPDLPASTAAMATVIAAAKAQLGKPYVWGAVGPDSFDCSGFTGYAYAAAGIALPRTAAQQYLAGPHPTLAQLQPGDLLFWATDPTSPSSIDHMAMYLGNALMIVAPHTGDVVKISQVYANGYFGATRVDARISGQVPGPQWADSGRFPRR